MEYVFESSHWQNRVGLQLQCDVDMGEAEGLVEDLQEHFVAFQEALVKVTKRQHVPIPVSYRTRCTLGAL